MTNKEIAKDFILKCVGGKAYEAFKLYVEQGFKHHNVYFKGNAHTKF